MTGRTNKFLVEI